MGQKLRYGRPCTRELPGTHNWLAQSRIASIFSDFHCLMLAQSCTCGVNCCFIGVTHPAACTRARVPLTFGHVHRPPPNPICSKRVPIDWAWAEDSVDIFKMLWSGPGKFWRGGLKNSGPPPLRGPIYIPIDSFRRQDSEYENFNQFDVQKLCFLHPPASGHLLCRTPLEIGT
jgi:hypothetical protein